MVADGANKKKKATAKSREGPNRCRSAGWPSRKAGRGSRSISSKGRRTIEEKHRYKEVRKE